MSVPAHAVHTASIPLTELLLGFSSWNPDTSGNARNSKLSVPFHASGTAFLMMFAAPYEHMEIATEIVEKEYGKTLSGIESERLLLENGYIGFYSRDVGFQWFVNHFIRPLTDEQVTFVVENMKYANNSQQKQSIQELLERNDDVKSRNILDFAERAATSK